MPEETEFKSYFQGICVNVQIAEPIYIVLSKARAGRLKDIESVANFLRYHPEQKKAFEIMLNKYGIDLKFMKSGGGCD